MWIQAILLLIGVVRQVVGGQIQLFPVTKEVTASTLYHLSMELTSELPTGSIFTFDYSNTDIGTQPAELFSCYHKADSSSPQVAFTSCSCDNSKKCYATSTTTFAQGAIVNLYMGNMNNPVSMKPQSVPLVVTYNSVPSSTQTITLTVTGGTYIAQTIDSPTLSQASNEVLAANKFTVVFQPKINVPQNSRVVLRLPSEISVSTSTVLIVKGKIGSNAESTYQFTQQQSQDQKDEIVVTNIFSAGEYQVNLNLGPVTISLSNLVNPGSVTTLTSGILLMVTSNSGYLSQQTATTDLTPSASVAKSVSITNDEIFTNPPKKVISTELQSFGLQFTPSVAFDTEATIQIEMPAGFTFNEAKLTNSIIFGSSQLTINLDGQKINIRGASNSGSGQWIVLYGIISPPNTKTTESIKFKIYDKNNYLVQEYKGSITYNADTGDLTMLNSTPLSSSSVLTADTDLTFEIQLAHPIEEQSYIYVTIPETVAIKKDPSVMNCFKVVSSVTSSHACTVVSTQNSQLILKMKEFCSSGSACPAQTTMKFTITGTFANPAFIKTVTDSMTITTYMPNEDGQYDSISSGVVVNPALNPNPLSDLIINYQNIAGDSSSPVYSEADRYVATFSPYPYFRANGGILKFSLPKAAMILKSTSAKPQCYLSSTGTTTDCEYTLHNDNDVLEGIATVSLQNVCSSNTCATGTVTLRVTQFLSPLNNQPIDTSSQAYTIQTYTTLGYYLSLGTKTTLTSSGNQGSLTFRSPTVAPTYSLTSTTVNQLNVEVTIQLRLDLPYPPKNHAVYKTTLQVQLPVQTANFQLDSTSACSVSEVLGIQFTCVVSDYSQGLVQITYSSSSSSSADNWAKLIDRLITLKVTKATNPASLAPTSPVTITSLTNTDNKIQESTSLRVTLDTVATLKEVTVGRTDPAVLSAKTVLTFTITLATRLYNANSYIKLDIARQQAIFQTTADSLLASDIQDSLKLNRVGSNNALTVLSFTVPSITDNYVSIYFQEPSCSCAADSVLTYQLSNGDSQVVTLRNPPDSSLATNSVKVFTYDSAQYGVDSKETDILIKPFLSTGQLTLDSISTSSRLVFQPAKLTIRVKTQTKLLSSESNNQVVVQLPQYLYYPTDQTNSFSPTCFINTQQLDSCTTLLQNENGDTTLPKYVSVVYLPIDSTALDVLNTHEFFDIIIQGQLNFYDFFTATASQNVVVSTTTTAQNYMQDTLTISLENKNLFPNQATTFKSIAVSRTSDKLGVQVTVLFTLTFNSIVKASRAIYVKVPKSQLKTMTPAPECHFKVGSDLKSIVCLVVAQDALHFTLEVQNSLISYCNNNAQSAFCDANSNLALQVTNLENNNELPDLNDVKSVECTLKDDSKVNTIIQSSVLQQTISPVLVVGNFLDLILTSDNGLVAKDNTITINGKLQNQLMAQSKISVTFSNDMLLISNSYQLACKLATLPNSQVFSIQDLRDVECTYKTDPLSFAIKEVTISNPCRFDSSCPIDTQIYIQMQSANLLYRQTFSGTIDLIGYSVNNLQVVSSQMSHSNLKSLVQYPLANHHLVLTRSSSTPSANTAITIHYTSPTRLITGAILTFYLPKTSVVISSLPTCTPELPAGFNCALELDSSDSDYYQISTTQTFCMASHALFCEAGVQLKFTLSGSMVTNPADMKVSGVSYNKLLVTYTSQQHIQGLSDNYNNVIAPPVSKGTITNIKVTRSVGTAYTTTKLSMTFTLQTAMGDSDYVVVQLPKGMASQDTPNLVVTRYSDQAYSSVLRTLSSSSVTPQYSSSSELQHILMAGLCSGDCSTGQTMYLTIDKVRNNYYVPTLYPALVVSSLDSSQKVIDSGSILHSAVTPVLTPYGVSVVTVARSVRDFTLESDFTFTIKFQSDQVLETTTIIRLTLPKSQLQKVGEDYYLLKSDDVSRVALTKVYSTTSAFFMEFLVFDTSSKDYSFVLKGFQNSQSNPSSDSTNSIFVELLTQDYQLMSKNSYNVMVQPTMLLATDFIQNLGVAQDNLVDGQPVQVTYSFQLKNPITDGTQNDFALSLPQYRFYYVDFNKQSDMACEVHDANKQVYLSLDETECKSTFDSTHQYITSVTFKNICNSKMSCTANNQQVHLRFRLKNQPSTRPYNKNTQNKHFGLRYSKDGQTIYDLQYLYTQPTATHSPISEVTLSMSDTTVQKTGQTLDLQFSLSNIVPKAGNISVTLPSQMVSAIPSSCSASQVVSGTETALSCRPTSDGLVAIVQSYKIVDTYDLYGKILVKAKVQGLTNPMTNLPTDPLSVTSYGMYVDDSYQIDRNDQPVTYTASTLGALTLNTVTRSVADLNADITLTMGLTTTHAIPAGGFLMLEVLPSYQVVFKVKEGALLSCSNSLNSDQAIKCYAYGTYIKVVDLCGVNTLCAAASSFNIIVTSGLRNPRFVKVTSMKWYTAIQVQNKIGFIDGKESGIMATPSMSPTVLTVSAFSRNHNGCLGDTQLSVQFSSTNPWLYKDQSKFQIEVPQNVLLPSVDTAMKCRVNDVVDVACNYTLYSGQEVNTIKTIDVHGFCQQNDPCLANEKISIVIDGLMNSYDQWDYSGQQVYFRTHIQNYANEYVENELVSAGLSTYFSPSSPTSSSLVDVRPSTPITAFSNVLQITMALNTYLVKGQHLILSYDQSLMPNNLDNVSCEVVSGVVTQKGVCEKQGSAQLKVSLYLPTTIAQSSRLLVRLIDFVNPAINNGQQSQSFSLFTKTEVYSPAGRLQESYSDSSRMAVTVYTKRTNKDCTDKHCQYCLLDQKDNCIQCTLPGSAPLLYVDTSSQNSKGSCHSECPSGSYNLESKCLNCNANCKQCLGPKQDDCTACDVTNSAYNVFDSGRCGKACKKGQQEVANIPQVFPVESAKVCSKNNGEECQQDLCGANCMSDSKYCSKQCKQSSAVFSFSQKQCVDQCESGYTLTSTFLDYKTCTKCSDQCKTCLQGKPSTCSQCNPLFINKYNHNEACVKQCPFKYFAEPNTNICKTCPQGCSSCRGAAKEDCMSCDSGRYYYYGECLTSCPLGTTQQGASCVSGCANTNCLQCQPSDTNKCTACRGLNNILYLDNCISQCPQGTYQDGLTCKPCLAGCKSCSDGSGCDLCTDPAKSVYKGTCVDQCPSGYSRNYLTSVCMQFNCQAPCDQCAFYENECVTCQNSLFAYKLECHFFGCPSGSFSNSTALRTCDTCQSPCKTCTLSKSSCDTCQSPLMLYDYACDTTCPMQYQNNAGICEYVQYPAQAAVIVALALLALLYLSISWFKKKSRLQKVNAVICLCGPLIFITRICLLLSYSLLRMVPLVTLTMISIVTNILLSVLLHDYIIKFRANLPTVQRFVSRHTRGYRCIIGVTLLTGPKFFKVFSSGLWGMPTYHFDRLPPYLFSHNRLLRFSLVLALFQCVASLYTVVSYNSAVDAFHLSVLDILFSLLAEVCVYYKSYKDQKLRLDYSSNEFKRLSEEDEMHSEVFEDVPEDEEEQQPEQEEKEGSAYLDNKDKEEEGEEEGEEEKQLQKELEGV